MRKLKKTSSFFKDGIELVSLVKIYDGDTAVFKTSSGNIDVRFLGINAPENTKRIEPFGEASTKFCKDALEHAKFIIIESDKKIAEKDNIGSRYLAYIWYGESLDDLFLYQEDVLAMGLAKTMFFNNVTLYNDTLEKANKYAKNNNLGIYSGDDPNFNYETVEVTVNNIVNNNYQDGSSVKVEGIITGKCNMSFFITDNISSIYIYNVNNKYKSLKVGDKISLIGQYSNDDIYGLQITNITNVNILSKSNKYNIKMFDSNLYDLCGNVINVDKMLINNVSKYKGKGYINSAINGNDYKVKVSSGIDINNVRKKLLKNHIYNMKLGVLQQRNSYNEEPFGQLILLNDSIKKSKEMEE